jgi:hypothetical protein
MFLFWVSSSLELKKTISITDNYKTIVVDQN